MTAGTDKVANDLCETITERVRAAFHSIFQLDLEPEIVVKVAIRGFATAAANAAGTIAAASGQEFRPDTDLDMAEFILKKLRDARASKGAEAAHIREHGTFRRADAMRIGEISIAQASADIAALIEDFPDLALVYDRHAKTYRSDTKTKPTP